MTLELQSLEGLRISCQAHQTIRSCTFRTRWRPSAPSRLCVASYAKPQANISNTSISDFPDVEAALDDSPEFEGVVHEAKDELARIASAAVVQAACEENELSWESTISDESQFYDWKYNSRVHYTHQGSKGPSILLVHGFGVGGYQFKENMDDLSKDHSVWALDLLGQGCSWPSERPKPEDKLQYSLDTWTDQLTDFVRDVIQDRVYVAGNSLGGLLAVSLASRHPELVKGVVLLNAAPFWSFAPRSSSLLARLMPYNGTVPAPMALKNLIGRFWFSRLSNPDTIKNLVQLVYKDNSMIDADFLARIVASAKHPDALEAFASIIFSPSSEASFNEMAQSIEAPLCLVYGRDDPWIVPLWGQRLKRLLPHVDYYELSPAGHCPHHETPVAVDTVMRDWILAEEAGAKAPLAMGSSMTCMEADGRDIVVTHTDGLPRNLFERFDHAMWRIRKFLAERLRAASPKEQSAGSS